MKNFKFFSRILCIFVLIFVFTFNSFAYSISDYSPVEDIITNNASNEVIMDIMSSPSLLTLSEPNFDFNPQNIPWLDAPTDVQDIIYSELPSLGVEGYIKVPFALVVVQGSYARAFVGYNLCLGRIYTYNANSDTTTRNKVRLMYFNNLGSSKYSICYSADFNLDYSIRVPWHSIDASDFGTNGNCEMFTQLNPDPNANIDFYCFGANYGKDAGAVSFTVYCNNTTDGNGNKVSFYSAHVLQSVSGFSSGRFVTYPEDFPNYYFSSFSPKSLAQVEQETQKGIWDSIKSIPDLIADKLKGLFIPEDGFFTEYFNNLQTFFSEKLGFLVYPFDFIITFLNKYMNIGDGDGVLHLPDFEIMDVKIFTQTDFNLKNAMTSFLGEYYNIYFAFVDFIILVGLVNLALKKFNSITGGNSE